MSEVIHTVARSMGEATGAAARMIEKCLDHAIEQMQQAELQASGDRRQELADAWRELAQRRKAWSTRFPELLGAAFEADARNEAAPAAPRSPGHDQALTLLDDTELTRSIESSRLAQLLASQLERPLAELDALMSSALQLPGVQPERNPLRPAVYAQVLRDMLGEQQPDPARPGLWLRYLAAPLADELGSVYRDQAQFLTLQRVHAASYRLRAGAAPGPRPGDPARPPGAPATAPAPAATAGAAGPESASGFAELGPQQLDAPRLHRFLMQGEAHAHRPLAPSYYAQAHAELRAVEAAGADGAHYDPRAVLQHMHVPPVDRPARPVDTASPLPPETWGRYGAARERALVHGRLKTQAREVGQVLGLEVVRRLVNRVADDPRLLGPVREAIVGLEPALLRLAMVAPRFFSDSDHAGRLLLEKVAQRSFKYNDEFSVEFQGFFRPVAQGFQRLNQIDPMPDAEPFRATLASLQAGWAAQDTLDEEAQRKVLDAVQFAEQRQQEADRIATEFRQRSDLEGVTEPVRDFVLGPWALVVAHARLAQPAGGVDPGGHLAVVSDLLWSVKRELALHEPARAFELIPRILLKLRSGLLMIGQQPADIEPFFHQLEVLHRPVLKLRARHRHREVAPPAPPPVLAPAAPARLPGQPWMAAQELHAAGFEEAAPSDFGPLHASASNRPPHASAQAQALGEPEAERIVSGLAPGCWVDLYSRQQWRRAHLKWASDKRTLFMFVSHGGQPHSMTRRSLQRLIRERLVRTVDAGAVLPRALAQLTEQAPAAAAVA
jgi:hypothetical protein